MNASDPLAGLKDLHLPPPVGWWPPAPGWWGLAMLVLVGLGVAGYFLGRYFWRNRYRRVALRELRLLRENASSQEPRCQLELLAALLRRVAMEGCGRTRVAPLSGAAWLELLDRTGRTNQFSAGPGRVLGQDLYRPIPAEDPVHLYPLVEEWIRRHRSC